MHLKLLLPTQILVDREVSKINAEAPNGAFCLLPRHVDFVTALAPGIVSYWADGGDEQLVAVDEGTLVKCASDVMISVRNAIPGEDLGTLREVIRERFETLDERERHMRTAIARLEAGAIRRFIEIEEAHG